MCMSCNKQKVPGYAKVSSKNNVGKKFSSRTMQGSSQYGTPKVRISFAKRGS